MGITQAQKFLLESDFVLELLKQIPASVFWKDKNSIYLGCNDAFSHSLGLSSPKDVVGKTDYDLPTAKKESDAFRATDKQVMESKIPKLNIEEYQTLPDGRKVVLLTSKVPLFDKKRNVVGILGVYYDITERKKAESLKIEHEILEKRLDTAKTLAATIAHELRTPLLAIRIAADVTKDYLPDLLEAYKQAKAADLPVKLY